MIKGPDVACHPANNTIKSCKELWNKPETILEFDVLFRSIMAYTWDLEVLALKHPQKSVGYKSLKRVT